jgi:hypothetical protein
MDVYLTKRRVFIVDFNTFSPVTDALLYDWSELLSTSVPAPSSVDRLSERLNTELRLTPQEGQRRGNTNQFGLPIDLVDVSSTDAINAFAKLIQQGIVPQ